MPPSNKSAFYTSRLEAVQALFEQGENDPDLSEAFGPSCEALLSDESLPLYHRVICHYMMAHIVDDPRIEILNAFTTLDMVEEMVKAGAVEETTVNWAQFTRAELDRIFEAMLQASYDEEDEVAAEEEQVEEEGTIGTDVPPSESQTTDLGDSQATVIASENDLPFSDPLTTLGSSPP